MAIAPNNYPFSGGAFMGGANTPVNREDIHTLTLTKGSSSLGQYNPLIGDTTINIPSDASDDTSTFTKASGDTSSMTSGSKLSALFTAISSFFASILSTIGGKADKVSGATSGNFAALDADGNLIDSETKPTDFKTKQTAVTDPTADGFGLSFIDSVSQNANGEMTPHKKTVQDGSTVQKGVVQLQDSVGSTESVTDRAVTPHAVRAAIDSAVSSAYHAAGTKTVAQLTGSLLIAENEGCVYNITDSGTTTSDFVDGAGHQINAGDNVGVCDVGGGVYKFDLLSGFVDLSNYLTNIGNASNTTSALTKNASDTSSMTSGGKLSELFTAISDFFASLKALAFKNTVDTSDIADDAITAAKVKDNETLPVNISGNAASATKLSNAVGSASQPVYVDSDGSVKACDVGTEFFIDRSPGPDGSNYYVYYTIAWTGVESGGGLSDITLEIGPLGADFYAGSTVNGKYIVTLHSYGGSNKANVLMINMDGVVPGNLSFFTHVADGKLYLDVRMYAYKTGAYAKVISHGKNQPYGAGILYYGRTAPAGATDSNVTYERIDPSVNFGTPIARANVLNIITA